MPSVKARTVHSAKAPHDEGSRTTSTRRAGENSRRMMVTALAGVISAEGP